MKRLSIWTLINYLPIGNLYLHENKYKIIKIKYVITTKMPSKTDPEVKVSIFDDSFKQNVNRNNKSYVPPQPNPYTPFQSNPYTPFQSNPYTPPIQSPYTPPTQSPYTPPIQSPYTPPIQSPYTPPQTNPITFSIDDSVKTPAGTEKEFTRIPIQNVYPEPKTESFLNSNNTDSNSVINVSLFKEPFSTKEPSEHTYGPLPEKKLNDFEKSDNNLKPAFNPTVASYDPATMTFDPITNKFVPTQTNTFTNKTIPTTNINMVNQNQDQNQFQSHQTIQQNKTPYQFPQNNKKNAKLVICVYACPTITKYKKQIQKVTETWGKIAKSFGIEVLYFLGEEKTEFVGPEFVYLPGVKNDYKSASFKQNLGLKYIHDNYNAEFILVCGTDTYVNIRNIMMFLREFTGVEKSYIGGHDEIRVMDGQQFVFHDGGAGFVITGSLLNELYPHLTTMYDNWSAICARNGMADLADCCDVCMPYFIYKYVIDHKIYTIYDGFYRCNYKGLVHGKECCARKMDIRKIITCHFMSLEDFDAYYAIETRY